MLKTTPKLLSVSLGAGLVRALQLDDASMRASFGDTGIEYVITHRGNRITVIGSLEALESLRGLCRSTQYNADPVFARSAARAFDTLTKFLASR